MAATKSLIAGAALAAGVSGLRTTRKGGEKTIGGVVVHHYEEREVQKAGQMQTAGADATFDWVVMFNQGTTVETIDTLCADAPACVSSGDNAAVPFATVRGTESQLGDLLERHAQDIMFAEPDMPLEEPDQPMEDEMSIQGVGWNLEKVGVPNARFTGQGTHIYVMDTGVRVTHRDFGGRAIPTIDTVLGNGRVVECAKSSSGGCASDSNGHGTHCAGTAGGTTYGVAKKATVHAMKVCCGYGSNILAGMDWLVANKIKPAVMTMSLGSYSTPESSRVAVDAVVAAGVTVTVSAGNRDVDSCSKSYTFIASAIGVGSTTTSDTRSSFSNWGSCNAIYAPGSSIVSASKDSDTGSATKSGTSMAAPCVAGAVALLLEESPRASPSTIRSLLRSRATKNVLSGLKAGDPNLLLNVA